MRRVFNLGCLLLIFAWTIVSCGKDPQIEKKGGEAGNGRFALKLGTVGDFEVVTRSGAVAVEDFKVRITGTTLRGTEYDTIWKRYADMPSIITIPAGQYTIESYNGEQRSGFEMPYYYGKREFSVGIQELIDAQVTCKLACVKVTLNFTPLFLSNVNASSCMVYTHEGDVLEFTPDNANLAGYMAVPTDSILMVNVRGAYAEDGTMVNQTFYIKQVEATQWHKISLSINTSAGVNTGDLLDIDHTIQERDTTVTIPGGDDIIDNNGDNGSWDDDNGGENPGGGDNPGEGESAPTIVGNSFNGAAFNIDETLVITDAQSVGAVVEVLLSATSGGIQNLYLTMASDDVDLHSIFTQLGATDANKPMDLANPDMSSTWAPMFTELGLISATEPIKGKKQHTFSVGGFMELLSSGYTHTFNIKIVDAKGKQISKALIIKRTNE